MGLDLVGMQCPRAVLAQECWDNQKAEQMGAALPQEKHPTNILTLGTTKQFPLPKREGWEGISDLVTDFYLLGLGHHTWHCVSAQRDGSFSSSLL